MVRAQRRAGPRWRSLLTVVFAALAASVSYDSSAVLAAPTEAEGGPGRLRIGEAAPPLAAERIAGADDVSLAHLHGRVVVIDFWATWCRPCRAIMPSLDQLHRRHHGRGLTILGVTRERRTTVEAHLQRSPVAYTVARDLGATQRSYGVSALPTLVVLDRRGRVREVRIGGGDMATLEPLLERLLAEPMQ